MPGDDGSSDEPRRDFILNTAVGLSTDFTDGLEQEAPPRRCFHVTRGVKRQPFSTGFQSVESAICGSNRRFQVYWRIRVVVGRGS